MITSIEFENIDGVIKELESVVDSKKFEEALGKACALVERSAKQKAPKDTGELRRSITSKVEENKGIVYSPLEYAPYVEYGTGLFAEGLGRLDVPWFYKDDEGKWHMTSGMHPQPYMRPALYENRSDIVRLIKEGMIHG